MFVLDPQRAFRSIGGLERRLRCQVSTSMTRHRPSPPVRFGLPAARPVLPSTASHARFVDGTVSEWTTDLNATGPAASDTPLTVAVASGFVDFDVVESVHASSYIGVRDFER